MLKILASEFSKISECNVECVICTLQARNQELAEEGWYLMQEIMKTMTIQKEGAGGGGEGKEEGRGGGEGKEEEEEEEEEEEVRKRRKRRR